MASKDTEKTSGDRGMKIVQSTMPEREKKVAAEQEAGFKKALKGSSSDISHSISGSSVKKF